jgi:hypothetical protein
MDGDFEDKLKLFDDAFERNGVVDLWKCKKKIVDTLIIWFFFFNFEYSFVIWKRNGHNWFVIIT